MKILICGDRNWTDREKVAQHLRILRSVSYVIGANWEKYPIKIIHGAARGADRIAGEEAKQLGFQVEEFPADWQIGRAAGVLRNQLMLEQFPDLVLAFHSNIEESKGTKDMVRRARDAQIPTEVIS